VKVVLFCGGQGLRVRDHDGAVPKPMVHIGNRPILWHLMKYYAHFGHRQFVLCLGYKSDVIKDYFLNYKEWVSNDFVLSNSGRDIRLLNSDIDDWEITFADTGSRATIGERLLAVKQHLDGEETFLANYADGLTDLWLPDYLDAFEARQPVASFLAVHSPQSFHVARIDSAGLCTAIEPLADAEIWFNAGYFILRREIFDYVQPGDELVVEPFNRLIAERKLMGHRYEGFWEAMDTFKDLHALEARYQEGDAPWQVWQHPQTRTTPIAAS
jgi:glucose-1-phosphate cytidylyltransferase